jgi:hypothetical protein
MPDPWDSVDDVATHLHVAKDWVFRSIEQKGPPTHPAARLWKFKLSELGEWVHAGGAAADDDKKEPT